MASTKLESWFDQASIWSRMYNLWSFGIVWRTLGRSITVTDLGPCPSQFQAKQLADFLEKEWRVEVKKSKPSLARCTLRLFGLELVPLVLIAVFKQLIFSAVKPLMMANMIQWFGDRTPQHYSQAWLNCAGMLASDAISTALLYPKWVYSEGWGRRVKIAWTTLIYRKTLRLNPRVFHQQQTTVGQIVNMMSDEASSFEYLLGMLTYAISTPLSIVISTYLCYQYVGGVTFLGIGISIALLPVTYFLGKFTGDLYRNIREKTDYRVNLMSEIVKFMRIIKMYAWEKHFHQLITDARREEMAHLRRIDKNNQIENALWSLTTPLTIFSMLVVYALQGNTLNAHKVYTVISVFGSLISDINWLLGGGFSHFFEMFTSSKRVEEFLMLEEMGENRENLRDSNYQRLDQLITYPIVVDCATIQWQQEGQNKFIMENISLRLKRGELLTVIGAVGSGKSTFLASLLNEPSIVSGSVRINGKVAYASQESWCFNDTIEANILFGQPRDKHKFAQVIEACALRSDLEEMAHREKTLVGERGVILSGGQKARVALARALYSEADIYLLDDPLSAVDAEVAKHIFEHCIEDYLHGKTIVLVTHQVQFINKSSKILVLDKGQPLAYGTYDQVIQSNAKLIDFIRHANTTSDTDSKEKHEKGLDYKSQFSTSSELSDDGPELDLEDSLVEAVSLDSYRRYFQTGARWPLVTSAIGAILAGQILYKWSDVWLSQWTNAVDSSVPTSVTFNALVYFFLLVGHQICTVLESASLHSMCLAASTTLHNRVFNALMRAPIAFFDKNPAGRILNRLTKDLRVADVVFESVFSYTITTFLEIIGAISLISYFRWQLILPAVIVFVMSYQFRKLYAQPSRDLIRLEGTLSSPVTSHTHLTLGGLSTIRAFQAETLILNQFYRYQNDDTNGSFTMRSFSNLFSMVVTCFGHFYVFCTAIALVWFYGDIQSGTAGLMMTLAFSLSGLIGSAIRWSVNLESEMASVERLEEYTKLEQEGELESNYHLPDDWPSSGRVEFDHVSLTYDGCSQVLKDLCFEVNGGEKVSIVGRTGAGKSSIVAALFRMVEVSGRVTIDGVSCRAIGLSQLRQVLSIIPQEPMAFVGSLRANLDPLGQHSDSELWEALDAVQLRSTVQQWDQQLDFKLSEGGANLSVGQRQLVCLARALLRRNQILILDEATAHVDHHTDQLIQRTIRKCFAHCTVITIAHRLNTIIDSHRVLVLDAGRIVQFDTPRNLLRAKSGHFYHLVQQTGPEMAAKLESIVFNSDCDI